MRAAVPFALCAGAAVLCASFIARGLADFTEAPPAPSLTARPAPLLEPTEPSREVTPDIRAILARNIFDSATGSLWPPPPPPPETTEEDAPKPPPEPGPCDDEVRVAGAAYIAPERGQPVVVFSGPDVERSGARSVGMRIADKTLTAIYPNVVVLTGDDGGQCWIKMRSDHAREVKKTERRIEARAAMKRHREEAKRKAEARKARKKKKKKKR